MICPHCKVAIHEGWREFPLFPSTDPGSRLGWEIVAMECPNCHKPIVSLAEGRAKYNHGYDGVDLDETTTTKRNVWPGLTPQRSISVDVPEHIAHDFQEASQLVSISPKASAALSRRCLERVLHEAGGAKSEQLTRAIDEAIEQGGLSSVLADELRAIKEIGNFAAHPRKDTHSGEIFDVEPEEAEWTLDVLEHLFDHYYLKPAASQRRKAALNEKLSRAGKRPIEPAVIPMRSKQ